ncbi:MAG TPA: glycoside hydrolase family 9 protein [Lacunisphaera sp.]|nr:glycoside hydrolase family 9 protein [Lacunisphaera sp.]
MKRIAAPAFVLLLGLAACNSDTASNSPTGSTSSGTPPASTPTTPTTPAPAAPGTSPGAGVSASDIPGVAALDYLALEQPIEGDNALRIVTPTVLELTRLSTKRPDPATMEVWNFVDANGNAALPAAGKFTVTVNGQPASVMAVGFKRRPLYAPLAWRDLRVESVLYLKLGSSVGSGQRVEVKNPDGSLWPSTLTFAATAETLRFGPALHVNQEGYLPNRTKKALVGYYLGSLGELEVPAGTGFQVVDATSGSVVFTGSLTRRADVGWTYAPTPYQQVAEADFSSFNTPGKYRLVVPGWGASIPFRIDEGIAMGFVRAYALGLYHQRCGMANEMPFTRHTHGACHLAPATVPVSASTFAFTWNTISSDAGSLNANNPAQLAAKLTNPGAQLYPFVNQGPIDVSGGHHDAGDYSKYTINSATLVHTLMFAVDSIAGAGALDNLGLPESGDGISDIMQEAKIEADFLAKLQDADGGFYFLVYPRERKYESNVTPDHGDAQVVWPKNTAATAAAVAALAEIASSPKFKAAYPQAAATYLNKAKAGWNFLNAAIAKYGKAGAYQKITHYGDDFTHDDELAWAAAAMFAATGDAAIHDTLRSWFNPADPATWRWGWWHCFMGWGNAVRVYAFAARSGRLSTGQLDAAYLAKCEAEVKSAGDDVLKWSQQSAYGTSFPDATKRVLSAGWYFSSSQAFDLTVAAQLNNRSEYTDAVIANLNYEAGANPVNVSYVTGMGRKRQHEIVHQYAQNDRRDLPPTGIPLGNLQTGPIYNSTYGTELAALTFPRDSAGTSPFPFYDRWTDTHNVTTEFVHLDQGRSLASLAFLAAQTAYKTQAWKNGTAEIAGLPAQLSAGATVTASLAASGLDLSGATIVWEAAGQPATFGPTFTFTTSGNGEQWVEAEAALPDGRRVFAVKNFVTDNGKPAVTIDATDATASFADKNDVATYTFTRNGDTSSPLLVKYALSGTAVKWNDYRRPEGDMPVEMTIPAGAASGSISIYGVANTTNANPATVTITVSPNSAYNVGTPSSATATIK